MKRAVSDDMTPKLDQDIMIVSDHYLKSRNCMFEVLEVIKDSQFQKKLAFIVLSDSDIQLCSSSEK